MNSQQCSEALLCLTNRKYDVHVWESWHTTSSRVSEARREESSRVESSRTCLPRRQPLQGTGRPEQFVSFRFPLLQRRKVNKGVQMCQPDICLHCCPWLTQACPSQQSCYGPQGTGGKTIIFIHGWCPKKKRGTLSSEDFFRFFYFMESDAGSLALLFHIFYKIWVPTFSL